MRTKKNIKNEANLLSEEKLRIMIREILNEEDLKEIKFLKKAKRKLTGQIILREEMFKWLDKAISSRKKILVKSFKENIAKSKEEVVKNNKGKEKLTKEEDTEGLIRKIKIKALNYVVRGERDLIVEGHKLILLRNLCKSLPESGDKRRESVVKGKLTEAVKNMLLDEKKGVNWSGSKDKSLMNIAKEYNSFLKDYISDLNEEYPEELENNYSKSKFDENEKRLNDPVIKANKERIILSRHFYDANKYESRFGRLRENMFKMLKVLIERSK